jgi:hypothetical protein
MRNVLKESCQRFAREMNEVTCDEYNLRKAGPKWPFVKHENNLDFEKPSF